MAEMEKRPWRFTIEFDEEKAKRNGYNVDDLYDCVGEYAEQMGNVRIGLGTWQAKNREVQFGAQCPVCATLSKQPWVMQNIKSWRTYEDMNEPDGEDYLNIVRATARNASANRNRKIGAVVELDRKEFHFDLDVDSLKRTYSTMTAPHGMPHGQISASFWKNMDLKNRSIQAMNLSAK